MDENPSAACGRWCALNIGNVITPIRERVIASNLHVSRRHCRSEVVPSASPRTSPTSARPIQVVDYRLHGKGIKVPGVLGQALIAVLEVYLDSRAVRVPGSANRPQGAHGRATWPTTAPLFDRGDGERITRGTLQARVPRAFKKAGLDSQRTRACSCTDFGTHSQPSSQTKNISSCGRDVTRTNRRSDRPCVVARNSSR